MAPPTDARRERYDRVMAEADGLLRKGDFDGAVKQYAAAAELARDGGAVPEMATALHRAAIGRDRSGQLEEALWFARQALQADESFFGPAHPAVARDLHSLGVVLARGGKPGEAVAPLRRSADISARFESARERLTTLLALGQALHRSDAPKEAAAVFSEAAELATASDGAQSPHAVRAMLSMATAQAAAGELAHAHATWAELTRRLAGNGVPPPAIATSLARAWQGLGTLALRGRGDRVDAGWMYAFAMALTPPGHPVHDAAAAAAAECGPAPTVPRQPDTYVVVAAPEGSSAVDVARPTGGRFTLARSAVPADVAVGRALRLRFGAGGTLEVLG